MNLIIIHFIRVSKVEIGHIYIYIYICAATLKSQSMYVDLERTRIVTMDL